MSFEIEQFDLTIAGLVTTVWQPDVLGKVPLILFSHGLKGCRLQSTFLTQALAGAGFVVIAPDHADAYHTCPPPSIGAVAEAAAPIVLASGGRLHGELQKRLDDMAKLAGSLRGIVAGLPEIDWDRFGLAGHSLGGSTVLGLGGAWPSAKMPGLKAILAMSPYGGPFETKGSLAGVEGPIMFQTGTADKVQGARAGYAAAKGPARYVEFKDASHFAWTDLEATARDSITKTCVDFFTSAFLGSPAAVVPGGDIVKAENK